MSHEEVARRIAGRARLVAVSKGASLAQMRAAYDAGQRDFGENRARQLAERAAQMPPDVRWHFIGNLQSRDVRTLAHLKPLVHSFDRPELAPRWPRDVPVLLQIDFTGLDRRNGLPPAELPDALGILRANDITVLGLSTLPPKEGDPRPVFRALRALRDAHGLAELSMGMSDDYEVAIEEGATMVRVGRAIFSRAPPT